MMNTNAIQSYMDEAVVELYDGLVCASNRTETCAAGRQVLDGSVKMTADSIFDLASIGKTQTAALCALLFADGKLDPNAPFTEYLPEHVLAKENCKITLRDLATHSGGFENDKPYMVPDTKLMFEKLFVKRPVRGRGEKFCYACSNFAYLGLIVEKLTGLDLDGAAKKMLWGPLGMTHTTWNTIVGNPLAVEYSPSTYGGVPVRKIGEHNDLCCHYAPRGMGNGSNFSTAGDMLKFLTDLIHREHFPTAYYDLLFTPCFEKDGIRRSFGWDMRAPSSFSHLYENTGFSDKSICHSGWTGGIIIADPELDFAGVVLGSQRAGKERTMGPRVHLLEMMASC